MHPLLRDRNLHTIFGITLTVIMGVSSVMPALPLMARELGIPLASVGLVLTAFTLPGIVLAPVAGVLADRLGRKRVLLPAMALFIMGGAACFFARDLSTLLACRFVQGFGAAPLGVLYTTLIGDLYEGNDRVRAMGYNAGVLSLGTAIFPAVGGLLAELGWNVPFLLPLAVLPLMLAAARLRLPASRATQTLGDYFRSTLGIVLSPRALVLFGLSLLTFVQLYGPMVTFFPVLADTRFHAAPSRIGAIFAVSSLGTAMIASQLGRLSERFPARWLIMLSHVLYAVAMLMLPLMPGLWWLLGPVVCFGMAQGLNLPNLSTMMTSLAPTQQRAAIMAVNGTLLRLGQTIAPLLFGLLYAGGDLPAVFTGGAVVSCLMLALAAWRLH